MKIIRILNEEKFPSLKTSTTNRYLETVNSDLAPSFPRFLHNFSKYYPQIINVNKNFKTFIPKHKREKTFEPRFKLFPTYRKKKSERGENKIKNSKRY